MQEEKFDCVQVGKNQRLVSLERKRRNPKQSSNRLAPTSIPQNRTHTLEYSSFHIRSSSLVLLDYCTGQTAADWIYVGIYTPAGIVDIYTGPTPLTTAD